MDNLIEPLMQGLTQALQIHGLVQHQRDQQEALQRQKFMDARNMRIQDTMLQNQQQDRQRKQNSDDMAQTMALNQSGATPLQNGLLSATIAPPAAQAPFSAQIAGTPAPSATPGALPLAAPPTGSMQFGDPLASLRASVQPTTVTAAPDPSRVVKANNGQQYQLPTAQQQAESANNQLRTTEGIKADAKQAAEQVTLPGGNRVDARAIPVLTNQNTVDAGNKRNADDLALRKTIAGQNDARDRKLAQDRENAANGRSAATNATTVKTAQMRIDQQNTLDPFKQSKLDMKLSDGMKGAERDYQTGIMKALARVQKDKPKATVKDIPADTMGELTGALNQAKQNAHDGYRQEMAGYGKTVAPIDFANQGKTAAPPAAASAATAPAAQTAAPAAGVDAAKPGGNVFPRAQLGAYAKRNNLSEAATEAELKKRGYVVQ